MKQISQKLNIVLLVLIVTLILSGCWDDEASGAGSVPAEIVQQQISPTATNPLPDPTATPTFESLATATSTATTTATETETPLPILEPSATSTPSATQAVLPSPTATMTPTPFPVPEWLGYLNRFRTMSSLPVLGEELSFSSGSQLHSQYMVVNDAPIAHSQDKENPYFDEAGDRAARNGNLFATNQLQANYVWSINFWASAPFHLIGMLDPQLQIVGYGDHVDDIGDVNMAGVLDIRSHAGGESTGIEFPILFPGQDSSTWIVRHSMFEWPDPLAACPGFSRPAGPAVLLLLGPDSPLPDVVSHNFSRGDVPLESCIFDQTNYINENEYAQGVGREILARNNAIVLIPREQLPINETYTVHITLSDQEYAWQFHTQRGPD